MIFYVIVCVLAVVGIAVTGFYSGAETGLYTVNRFRLRRRAHAGARSARLLARLLSDPVGLLATFLLGHNLAVFLVTEAVTIAYERAGLGGERSWWRTPDAAATLTLVLPLFVFSEVLPKDWFRRHTERLSYIAAWYLAATRYLLLPAVYAIKVIAALIPAGRGPGTGLGLPQLSRSIIDHLLSRGRETGALTGEQERLARNVLRSGNTPVARLARPLGVECCTAETEERQDPGVRTLAVPAAEIAGRVLQRMTASRARLALVIDRADASPGTEQSPILPREVIGYVRLFDLLVPGAQSKAVRALAKPVPRLGIKTTLRVALNTMQRECADVALVEPPPRRGAASAAGGPTLGVVRLTQLIATLMESTGGSPPTGTMPAG